MQGAQSSLWFVVDHGPDVYHNTRLDYHKHHKSGWKRAGSQALPTGVQQNVTSITSGNVIFSYGIASQAKGELYECYFSTRDVSYKACNQVLISGRPFRTKTSSNYVGAAIGDTGVTRLVWWTTVGSPGSFSYIYNFGGGWNGPITTTLPGCSSMAYARAQLLGNHVILTAQLYVGQYPNGQFSAGLMEAQLGSPLQFKLLLEKKTGRALAMSSADVFVHRPSKSTHLLATLNSGQVAYYFKPAGALAGWNARPSWVLPVGPARFGFDGSRLAVFAASPTKGELAVHLFAGDGSHALDQNSAETAVATISNASFGHVSSIYARGFQYQSSRPALDCVVTGAAGGGDHLLYHVAIKRN